MDLTLSQDEVIDPRYSWTGPDGRNLEGQGYANLTSSGELVLLGFQESMSGAYKCVLSHRIIETSTQKEVAVTNTYRFMVYAYREANHVYQVSVRFTSKGCELAANARFVEELKKILEDLISELMSRVEQLSHRCHSLEVPHRGSPSELFITFQAHRWSQNAAAALGARRAKRSSKAPKPPGEFSPVPPPTPRHISSHLPITAPDPGGTNRSCYGAAPPLSLSETNTQQTGSFSQSTAGQRRRGGEITRERENEGGERAGGSQQTPKKAARIPFVLEQTRRCGQGIGCRGSPKEPPWPRFSPHAVNPFAPGWKDLCSRLPQDCEGTANHRAQQARERIGEFFRKQTYALKHQFQTIPAIHYVEGSFSVTPIDSCRPGFGSDAVAHRSCAGCCVVCSPGTYSPDSAGSCRLCVRHRAARYGAKSCP
ncbi:zona pellucida-binding protein 2 [Tympanuchus pallidicinctus]|uniref:zona pellucida-binding protein 2 n=1 Tax=Tympanuchus pallidicinctus TaxID=109042 RepID=UPI002287063F|nr:zona pellucida-binding protein 2 [Tympanuchus pallidicinctus]